LIRFFVSVFQEHTSHEASSPTDKNNLNSSRSSGDEIIIDDDEARKTLDYDADDSPYPEVRAVVPAKDDPTTPTNTVRMWVIGLLFTVVSISTLSR
jgi:hypothetical protein